ncbi:MAG: hypothetical protein JSV80_02980 [Acidobacteriota bacterium]|nr:MAG: hypothetical protein JSV80_02980 [Acidobacteriota bacterium]
MPPAHEEKSFWERYWWTIPVGCLAIVALPICCCGGLIAGLIGYTGALDPYRLAVERVRASPEVIEALGEPIETRWTHQLELKIDNDEARLRIPLVGPKGEATVRGRADRRQGQWALTELTVRLDDGGEITLIPEQDAEPDSSG